MSENISRKTYALSAAGISALLVAAFALLSGGQRAATLGLTAHGDILYATDGGAADVVIATRLPAGSAGYILRSIGGTPTWRELSSSGTLASRPACAAGREGQEHWATDGATGLQRTRCVHQGAGTYAWTYVAYDVTAAGSAIARTDVSAAPDGGVLTVAGGVPQWAASAGAGALPSGTGFVTVSSGTGGVLTASSTSAADLRTALGAAPADWTTVTADALSLRDGTRGTVTLTGGRLRFSLDGAGLAYYDGTTRSSPRAYWVPPTTARQVLVVARVYTRVSGSSNASSSVAVLLRPGTDDTADPALAAPTPAWYMHSAGYPPALVGISLRDTTVIATGDYYTAGWDGSATGIGGGTWPTTPATSTGWIGARWTWPQRADYAAASAPADSPPLPTTFVWPASRVSGDAHSAVRDVGGAPMVVITYKMWAAAAAGVIDVDAVVYWR